MAKKPTMAECTQLLLDSAQLCQDENGEFWQALCTMRRFGGFASRALNQAVDAEIRREHSRILDEFEIEESEKVHKYKVRQLVWRG